MNSSNYFFFKSALATVLASAMLVGCGNISKVDAVGYTDNPVFPDPKSVGMDNDRGTFPNLHALKEVKAGMTKDQLYYLLGRPHFAEGLFGVREWDYLFHFHTPGQGTENITTCQFKVLYDKNEFTRSFFWKPVDPEDAVCPPSETAAQKRYTLASDGLFEFDRASLDALQPAARQKLDQLANNIQNLSHFTSVTVTGHTDWLGSHAYNQRLSEQRAQTARQYLISKGVPQGSIIARGMGETEPLVKCEGQRAAPGVIQCLAPNRRVEVTVDGWGTSGKTETNK